MTNNSAIKPNKQGPSLYIRVSDKGVEGVEIWAPDQDARDLGFELFYLLSHSISELHKGAAAALLGRNKATA